MKDTNIKKEKLNYMTYFRAFAILMIVAGHTIRWGKYKGLIFNLNDYLFTGGTFLFVFIAGFLFQYLAYKFNYKKYIIAKFKNVIMPYILTTIPIAVYFALTCTDPNNYLYQFSPIVRFIHVMFWGQIINFPLWFIPMITIFFIMAPILIKIKENKTIFFFVLISSFFYTILSGRPGVADTLAKNINVSLLEFDINHIICYFKCFLYFLSSYLLGMISCSFLETYMKTFKNNIKTILLISFSCWVYFYFLIVYNLHLPEHKMALGKFALIFLILSSLIFLEDSIIKHKFFDKVLNILADYSFGIFFIHYYFCNLLFFHSPYRIFNNIWYNKIGSNTLRSFCHSIGDFILVLFCSLITLFIIKKILEMIGIKNTRMFIGVGNTKQCKTIVTPENNFSNDYKKLK